MNYKAENIIWGIPSDINAETVRDLFSQFLSKFTVKSIDIKFNLKDLVRVIINNKEYLIITENPTSSLKDVKVKELVRIKKVGIWKALTSNGKFKYKNSYTEWDNAIQIK